MRVLLSVLVISFFVLGCEKKVEISNEFSKDSTAFHLAQRSCFSCHNPDPTVTVGVAPSLAEIKTGWMKASDSRDQFVENMVHFLQNPSVETSKMPEAVATYGLMPKLPFTGEDLQLIAMWMYDTPVEDRNWYQELNGNGAIDSTNERFLKKGQELALATKSVLGKNLIGAINAMGTEHALGFCNDRAMPLTDSMAVLQGASIRRVSDKPRNPVNQADSLHLQIIERMKKAMSDGKFAKPELVETRAGYTGYYSIETNKMCLQCHGEKGTDIVPAVSKKIIELYPSDQATGYGENQLRGIWVVEMMKELE